MNVLLSIIIPVYNVEKYLRECIESILPQLTDQVEILCINDGSTDKSYDILLEYKFCNNIKIYTKKNEGLSATRNYGVKKAIGKYVMFLDSDDYLTPDCLNLLLKILHKNYDLIISHHKWCYNDKIEICDEKLFEILKLKKFISNKHRLNYYIKNTCSFSPSVRYIIKKEFIEEKKLSFIVGILHEDLFWTSQVLDLINCDNVDFTNIIYYNHRLFNDKSITNNLKFKNLKDVFEGAKKLVGDINNKYIKKQISNSVFAKIRIYYNCNEDEKEWVEYFMDQNKELFRGCNFKHRLFYIVLKVLNAKTTLKIAKKFI